MTIEDWCIVAVLVLSVLGGLSQGFFRSVFSLGGLLLGLAVAAWNYGRIAALLKPLIRIEAVSDAVGFIVIAILVMGIFGLAGTVLHKTFRKMGLGCLDRLAGGVFGFAQGILLVTLCILVAVAFFPEAHWLVDARLPRMFFGACHLSTQVTPSLLGERIRSGLHLLEQQSPWWLHPSTGKP
jgi:membrane protein required for colicin V production